MQSIYTIGYEGTDTELFIQTLKAVGIKVLADIRAVPISRKKGFSKMTLKSRLEQEGIDYLHLAELGDPKPGRDAAKAGKLEVFKKIYTKHLQQPEQQLALARLSEIAMSFPTCLLCFERDPSECHRSIVAKQLTHDNLQPFDLYSGNPDRYARHGSKLPGRNSRESASAA
jgi:uncharacterized protein (DUF488 family)